MRRSPERSNVHFRGVAGCLPQALARTIETLGRGAAARAAGTGP